MYCTDHMKEQQTALLFEKVEQIRATIVAFHAGFDVATRGLRQLLWLLKPLCLRTSCVACKLGAGSTQMSSQTELWIAMQILHK